MHVASVCAQADEDQDYSDLEELQVTASRIDRSTYDVAAGVTVVGARELHAAVPQVLTDLLRGQIGAFVQQTTSGQGTPIIRGLKGSEVLRLVDGIRLNTAFFRNSPNQYLALVDAQNVRQLEVVRGPASALYGSDAMGGVVQILTPEPRFTDTEWSARGLARAQFASAERSELVRLSIAAGRRGLGITAGLTYQDVGNRRASGGRPLEGSGYRAEAANAKLLYASGDDRELMLDMQYLRQPRTPRHDELVPGFGQSEPASEVFNFEPNDRLFLHGRYRLFEPFGGIDELEIHAAYQEIHDDRRTRNFGSTRERRERNQSEMAAFTVQASHNGSGPRRWVWGAEAYFDEILSRRTETDSVTGSSEQVTSRFPDGSTMNSLAVYANTEMDLGSSLLLTAGGRFSHFAVDLPAADRGVGARLRLDDLTGNVGLNYRARPGLHLVANLGRGFRPPNVFDLGTLGERPGNRFNVANPGLGAEEVITVDFGAKVKTGNILGEVLVFRSDFRDKITTVPTGEFTAEGRSVVRNENVNELSLWGVETGGRWRTREAGELFFTLNYVRGEERFSDGSTAPGDRIPPLNGRLGWYRALSPTLWVEPYLRFAAKQHRLSDRDIGDPRIDPAGTAGWSTANLRVGWDVNANLAIRLNLENLADRGYREHGSGIDASGFNAVLTVEGRF